MNDSPIYEAIKRITERWHLTEEDIKSIYYAITDAVFYQELGHRLGTNYPVVADGPITLTPIRWEYDIVAVLNETTRETLSKWGKDGWELVSVDNRLAYFKRQCGS